MLHWIHVWWALSFGITGAAVGGAHHLLEGLGAWPCIMFVVCAFLATEMTWWLTHLGFELCRASLAPYKLRAKEQSGRKELVAEARRQHLQGYVLDPLVYTLGWSVSAWDYRRGAPDGPEASSFIFKCLYSMLGFVAMLLIMDFGLWAVHYVMHLPKFYRYHKLHHSIHIATPWTNDIEHPVEGMCNAAVKHVNMAVVSHLLGRLHPGVAFAFCAVITWYGALVHSGYNPPPFDSLDESCRVIAGPSYHEDHHFTNVGKLGAFTTIWDNLLLR